MDTERKPQFVMRKTTLVAFLTVVMLLSGAGVAVAAGLPPDGTFIDDDSNIHEPYIEAIAAADVTLGCNPPVSNRYCPDNRVSRGQMAAFLVRVLKLPAANRDYFVDDKGSIYEDPINRIEAAGITRGCNPPTNNRFCPGVSVTRAHDPQTHTREVPALPPH